MTAKQKTPDTDAAERKDAVKGRLYTKATARLREAHQPEFQAYLAEEYAEAGLEYKPRLTPEQKAEQAIAVILAEHPSLREKYIDVKDVPDEDEDDGGFDDPNL